MERLLDATESGNNTDRGSSRGKSGSGQLGAPAAALNLMQKLFLDFSFFQFYQNFAAVKLRR